MKPKCLADFPDFLSLDFLLLHKINWINLPSWKPVPRKFLWDLILMIYFLFLFHSLFLGKKQRMEKSSTKLFVSFVGLLIKFKLKLYMPPVQTMKINGISTELFCSPYFLGLFLSSLSFFVSVSFRFFYFIIRF